MSVSTVVGNINVVATDTISGNGIGNNPQDAVVKPYIARALSLTSSGTVPTDRVSKIALTLSSSTAQIDLNAVTLPGGTTASMTGRKLQIFAVDMPTGSSAMTFSVSTATDGSGYQFGGSLWSQTVRSGGFALSYAADGAPDISTSARYIEVSGTGSQTADVFMVFG